MAIKHGKEPLYFQALYDILTKEEIMLYKLFLKYGKKNGDVSYTNFVITLGEDYDNLLRKLRVIRKKIKDYHDIVDMSLFKEIDPALDIYIPDLIELERAEQVGKDTYINSYDEIMDIIHNSQEWKELSHSMDVKSALIIYLNSIDIDLSIISEFLQVPLYEIDIVLHQYRMTNNDNDMDLKKLS